MADNKLNANQEAVKEQPKQEVKEVLVETKKDTSTKPTSFEERAKIEAEVTMIKIGKDPSGRWIWKRSDKITSEDKRQRESMMERIRKGIKI